MTDNSYSNRAHRFATALPLNGANLRCLRLSVGIACAAGFLVGCDTRADNRHWTECVSVITGEHVQVIDHWIGRPHVRDARGLVFEIAAGGDEWRCKLAPGIWP